MCSCVSGLIGSRCQEAFDVIGERGTALFLAAPTAEDMDSNSPAAKQDGKNMDANGQGNQDAGQNTNKDDNGGAEAQNGDDKPAPEDVRPVVFLSLSLMTTDSTQNASKWYYLDDEGKQRGPYGALRVQASVLL